MDINDEIRALEELYDSCCIKPIADKESLYNVSISQKMKEIRPRVTVCHGQGYYDIIDEGEYVPAELKYSVSYDVPNTNFVVYFSTELCRDGFHLDGEISLDGKTVVKSKRVVEINVPRHCKIDYYSWVTPIKETMDEIVKLLKKYTKGDDVSSILNESYNKFGSFCIKMLEDEAKNN